MGVGRVILFVELKSGKEEVGLVGFLQIVVYFLVYVNGVLGLGSD